MLCECGFLAIFLGTPQFVAPAVLVFLFRWVEFRNMFGAGLIKLRGDDCWRELTCTDHHYEAQPISNPLSWVAHRLPDRFHRLEVLGNHVVELAVPFLYFGPPRVAAAGLGTVGFQGWLMLTGNFSFLNFLTIVLAGASSQTRSSPARWILSFPPGSRVLSRRSRPAWPPCRCSPRSPSRDWSCSWSR
jgi:hypothetical protein